MSTSIFLPLRKVYRQPGAENRLFFPLLIWGKQIGLCSTKFLREHNRFKSSPKAIFSKRKPVAYRILSGFVAFTFAFNLVLPPTPLSAQMVPQTLLDLPLPGAMISLTPSFNPPIIKGITINPQDPLEFNFLISPGDDHLKGERFRKESTKLIKYFLAGLTVPDEELWVNLSPYEKDRVIPGKFGRTEMGRDMLAQDYILKQLTASLMYPENELGKKFWNRVYKKTYEQYGTTEIPMNTFNKIWIVPDKAVVYEHDQTAFVVESHLKVMLEEDYVALQKNLDDTHYALGQVTKDDAQIISGVSSEIVREILIPEIEKEVNEGEIFTQLRQIYNSVILATWYKKKLKVGTGRDLSLLGQVYVNQGKTKGVDFEDKEANQKIYRRYVEAFEKGVYNYIKEDYDPATQEIIPRKYFSGGNNLSRTGAIRRDKPTASFDEINDGSSPVQKVKVALLEYSGNNEEAADNFKSTEVAASVASPVAIEERSLEIISTSLNRDVSPQTPLWHLTGVLSEYERLIIRPLEKEFGVTVDTDAAEKLYKQGAVADLVAHISKKLLQKIKESFRSAGFKDDFVSAISESTGLSLEIRKIFQDRIMDDKDETVISTIVSSLQNNNQISQINVAGEAEARLKRDTGAYRVVIVQDNSAVERKSSLGVGTMLGVYRGAELIGAMFFLNGPMTTLAVTDGKKFAHYAYDGREFVSRNEDIPVNLSEATKKDSPAALGGLFTEWPALFQNYYLENDRGIPGTTGETLKIRYSGVLDDDGLVHGATGANLYEILVNNGFLSEIVSLEHAKILSLFAEGSGGEAFIMTADGPQLPGKISGDMPAVQIYLGNKDAVGKLRGYFQERTGEYVSKEVRPRTLRTREHHTMDNRLSAVTLRDFLSTNLPGMDERPDIIGAVLAVAQAARKVGALYVAGARPTGEIDSGGAKQLAIDQQTDRLFLDALKPWAAGYYSEDLGFVLDFNGDGTKVAVMIDALDGSSRVRGNGGSGTIITFRKFHPGVPIEQQSGKEILASMIIAHNITPRLMIAVEGMGVYEFVFDGEIFSGNRAIDLNRPKVQEKGLRIAVGGERSKWPRGFPGLADTWTRQGAIPGYSGALVTDIFGVINHILDGGRAVFSYPMNKLRVKSELQAMAYLFKAAGGANLTYQHRDGKAAQNLTDLLMIALTAEPDSEKQQKAPSAFGDAQTIQEIREAFVTSSSPVIKQLDLNTSPADVDKIVRMIKVASETQDFEGDPNDEELAEQLKYIPGSWDGYAIRFANNRIAEKYQHRTEPTIYSMNGKPLDSMNEKPLVYYAPDTLYFEIPKELVKPEDKETLLKIERAITGEGKIIFNVSRIPRRQFNHEMASSSSPIVLSEDDRSDIRSTGLVEAYGKIIEVSDALNKGTTSSWLDRYLGMHLESTMLAEIFFVLRSLEESGIIIGNDSEGYKILSPYSSLYEAKPPLTRVGLSQVAAIKATIEEAATAFLNQGRLTTEPVEKQDAALLLTDLMMGSSPVVNLKALRAAVIRQLNEEKDPSVVKSVGLLMETLSYQEYFSWDDIRYTLNLFEDSVKSLSQTSSRTNGDLFARAEKIMWGQAPFMSHHYKNAGFWFAALAEHHSAMTTEELTKTSQVFVSLVRSYAKRQEVSSSPAALLDGIPQAKKALKDEDLTGETVLVRANLNVPIEKVKVSINDRVPADMDEITDETRLKELDDLTDFLLKKNVKSIIFIGHNGRLEDEEDSRNSVRGVKPYFLNRFPGVPVKFHEKSVTPDGLQITSADIKPGINIIENLRDRYSADFDEWSTPEQQLKFARDLAGLTSEKHIFISEAAADMGSDGTSIDVLPGEIARMGGKVYIGPASVKEFTSADVMLKSKGIRFVIFGGKKIDKLSRSLGIVENTLLPNGRIFFGSAATAALENPSNPKIQKLRGKLFEVGGNRIRMAVDSSMYSMPGKMYDIGPATIRQFNAELDQANPGEVIIVNGTMGWVEEGHAQGTDKVFEKLNELSKRGVIIAFVGGAGGLAGRQRGLEESENIIYFTGGGVILKLAAGEKLSGLEALRRAASSPVTLEEARQELIDIRDKEGIRNPETVARFNRIIRIIDYVQRNKGGLTFGALGMPLYELYGSLQKENLADSMPKIYKYIGSLEIGEIGRVSQISDLGIGKQIEASIGGLNDLKKNPKLSNVEQDRIDALIKHITGLGTTIANEALTFDMFNKALREIGSINYHINLELRGGVLFNNFRGLAYHNLVEAVEKLQFGGFNRLPEISTRVQETQLTGTFSVNLDHLASIRTEKTDYYLKREGDKVAVQAKDKQPEYIHPKRNILLESDYYIGQLRIRFNPTADGINVELHDFDPRGNTRVSIPIIERELTTEEVDALLATQQNSFEIEDRIDGYFLNRSAWFEPKNSILESMKKDKVKAVEINGTKKFVFSSPVTRSKGPTENIPGFDEYQNAMVLGSQEPSPLTMPKTYSPEGGGKAEITVDYNKVSSDQGLAARAAGEEQNQGSRVKGQGIRNKEQGITGDGPAKGGIDFNPALLDLQIKRDGNGVALPMNLQPIEVMSIDGFLPVIINITPVTNLPMLLGLADTEPDTDEININPVLKAREPEEISALN